MENKVQMGFAAVNKTLESKIPSSKEGEGRGKHYVIWGDNDDFPNFLYQSYLDCPIVSTIINGTADFICGNSVKSNIVGFEYPNRLGESWEDLFSKLAIDYLIFGVAYIQVIRNNAGNIAEFYHLDARYVRSDDFNQMFWYSKDFGKKWSRSNKALIYPKFIKDSDLASSIICIKTPQSRGVYGTPIWGSAIKSVMTEIGIDSFHLNELDNNFSASAILNFNNGQPSEEQVDEIEKNVEEKFTGAENAGRFLLSFNNGKDNATTVERLSSDDFDKRYDALAKKVQQQIFTAFGANPNLFGIPTENNGFSNEQYEESFRLYNRTRVKPIAKRLIDAFDKALGQMGSIIIEPFTLVDNNNEDNNIQ